VPAGEITAQTSYAVPCEPLEPPQPVLDPACGPIASRDEVAYQIGVTGSGFYRDATVFVATGGGDNADTVTAAADTEGSFSAILPARGQSDVGYRIHAYQVDSAGAIAAVARTPFTVPCPYDPSITLTPDAGPPGYTTRVTGTDFPPGEPVSLRWDRGLGAATAIDVSAGPDGAFEVYVFILPRDFQGPRMLAADTPQAPGAYPDVTAAFVVTAGQGMPGDRDRDDYIVRR
jgi:hypothetical protein